MLIKYLVNLCSRFDFSIPCKPTNQQHFQIASNSILDPFLTQGSIASEKLLYSRLLSVIVYPVTFPCSLYVITSTCSEKSLRSCLRCPTVTSPMNAGSKSLSANYNPFSNHAFCLCLFLPST